MPPSDPNKPPRGVVDPDWEAELRRGQAADGGQGSVDAELAMIHLLRHARAPEQLDDATLDGVWSDVHDEIRPRAWWRRPLVLWGGPALAAAAALVVVLAPPRQDPDADLVADGAAGMGVVLQAQFETLEPAARARVARAVDGSRGRLRGELLARATGSDSGSQGGAP